ncbi:MAG TPA: cellulase family glycosylhydrolase [Acidimicrobiales bacterium]|jgi:endoglycosylceramidase|nr:cellulase family glycosylhydrolase [Acidimicrobiales bacterium]
MRQAARRHPRCLLAIGALSLLGGLTTWTPPADATTTPQLPWLSISHPSGQRAQVVDPSGRTVILRGVNLVGLEDDVYSTPSGGEPGSTPFWSINPADYNGTCPANSHEISEPPVCEMAAGQPEYQQSDADTSEDDLAQMRGLGFNFIRLPVNWSQLEPTPGVYSTTYIDRIAQVVQWAAEQGIYVLIDMHEDNYSRFTPQTAAFSVPPLLIPTQEGGGHADGAPAWAVMGDNVPALGLEGQGEFNTYVEAAFTNFWLNAIPKDASGHPLPQGAAPGPGLQDHYIGAVAALVARFKGDSNVAGYDLMNEPLPGLLAAPGVFDQGYLYPFYRRIIDAVAGESDGISCPVGSPYTAVCGYRNLGLNDTQHLFFVEPMALRNETDFAVGLSLPFTSDKNIVYEPHAYTHVFTIDTQVPDALLSPLYPLSYNQAMVTADAEARALGAALFIGEYGNSNSDDNAILSKETAAIDQAAVGSSVWAWKGNCGPGATAAQCEPGLWSTYQGDPSAVPSHNGPLLATRLIYLARVYPRATAGHLLSFSYTPATTGFVMRATSTTPVTVGDTAAETIIYLPPLVRDTVSVSGAALLDAVVDNPDGSRLAYIAPTGHGAYGVTATK